MPDKPNMVVDPELSTTEQFISLQRG